MRIPGFVRTHRNWLPLGGIIALHIAVNVVWIGRDLSLRSFDGAPHIEAISQIVAVMSQEGISGLGRVLRGDDAGWWPTPGYLPWAAASLLCGHGVDTLRLFNLVYLGVLVLAVFVIGRRLHSPAAGLLAAALVTLYPAVYGDSRQIGLDLPGAALTALNVALLLATKRCSRVRASALLGLGVGIGILIRPQNLALLALPALLLLASGLVHPEGQPRLRTLRNAALALAAAAATSAVWWLGRLDVLFAAAAAHQAGSMDRLGAGFTAPFYLESLPWCFSLVLLLAGAIASGALVLRARGERGRGGPDQRRSGQRRAGWLERPGIGVLLAWLLGGALFLLTFRVKGLRYLLPLTPAVALLTGCGLLSIPHRWLRRVIVAVTLSAAVASWLLDSFNPVGPLVFGLDGGTARSPARRHAAARDLRVTSGPPQDNGIMRAAALLADQLQRRHGGGRGLFIHFRCDAEAHVDDFPHCIPEHGPRWLAVPVIAARLPGIRYSWSGFSPRQLRRGDLTARFGGARVPVPSGRVETCYIVRFRDAPAGGAPTPPPGPETPADLVFEAVAREHAAAPPVQITAWRARSCAFLAGQVRGDRQSPGPPATGPLRDHTHLGPSQPSASQASGSSSSEPNSSSLTGSCW